MRVWERTSVWSGHPSLMSLVGVRVSVQESLISSSSQDSPQGMDMEDWPLRRNKSWNPHEQLPWAQWTSLYLEKLNMLSINIEVLSGKGMRSMVGHHRSQCAYFLVFRCYSRETCTGLGKAVSSVPPLVRVPPVIHFALLIVQLELSLVSFEITFSYSYEHSSFQALLLRHQDEQPSLAKPTRTKLCASWNMTLCP